MKRMVMGSALATTGFNQETFDSFLAARREPAWLTALRREAWAKFQDLPWPHAGMEEWRRTDIRTFRLNKFAPPSADRGGDGRAPAALLSEGVELAGSSTTYNSLPGEAMLDPALVQRGVIFGSLDQLAAEHG